MTTSILATKMQELFLAYNLRLEDRVDAGMENSDVGNEHTNFGIKWFSDTDEIVPHFTLNLHKTVRGRRTGEDISVTGVDPNILTRRHVCRLCSQVYDLTGALLGPLLVTMRHYLSIVCKICLLYTSPSPRDPKTSRMPSSA